MRRFEHGDHQCFVINMTLDDALQAGLLVSEDGTLRHFSAFSEGRASYAFCQVCCHYAWSAYDFYGSPSGDPDDEGSLEEAAMYGFRKSAAISCADQERADLIREVMTS